MAKPTRALVAIAFAITILAMPLTTQADGHGPVDLPPAPPREKPAHPRLDSQLNRLAVQAAQAGQGGGGVIATSALMYSGSSVAVTVRLSSGADAIAAFIIEGDGGIAANVGEDYVEAYVPPPLLAELSELENVLWVETIVPPQPSVVSQGAAVHGAPVWNARGFTGAGVKVGIIDSGFQGFGALMGTELPSTVVARCYTAIGVFTSDLADCDTDGNHGTNVSEIVFDIAPQASMYIANAISGGDLQSIAAWMVSEGVSVVNMSLVWAWDGPGDGSSIFSNSPLKTVDQAVSGGITWMNVAGNHANSSWFGAYSDANANGWIEFSAGLEVNSVQLSAGQTIIV